ncbi:MAG: DUF302 domain-containing protein [Rhodobacteraceae bacterium]|nr:DUF302 domain-containing protein [Paracoccaceae bacterium]
MRHLLTTALFLLASPMAAQEIMTVTVPETVDDMEFAVESAIIDMGLTIDFVSYTGAMLERTGADVGSDVEIYSGATLYNFCSAKVSRQVLEADPANIAYCPYTIFVYSLPGNPDETIIGHQVYPGESMAPANALLDEIVQSATQ